MPAFTFEKISPTPRETLQIAQAVAVKTTARPVTTKQAAVVRSRGLIVDLLDRLAVSRMQRQSAKVIAALPSRRPPPD